MDSARWLQIRSVFERIADLPESEREAALDAACTGDGDLKSQVEQMLAASSDGDSFLDSPVLPGLLKPSEDSSEFDRAGDRVGPYRLVRILGHGGMGDVYLAERADGEFDQRVALKMIRTGTGRPDLEARFRHERQILALLSHPHIARLLDGGMTSEGPYLVMEYVEGEPIDVFCDDGSLPVEARLRLFMAACDAVHFAHRNLVVHRDLKPSNILVTKTGVVKLLDFGIARLEDEATAKIPDTRTGYRRMTPEYASPEQVMNLPITTASDVYSLGVVLYELLTGRRPRRFSGMSPAAIERELTGSPPPRPSLTIPQDGGAPRTGTEVAALRRRLRGDLDTIVLKALHHDPSRRYESAAAMADDVRRHLTRMPVQARPDTLGYRVSRFIQRNRLAVSAVVALVVVLAGGIFAAGSQAKLADERFQQIRALANTLISDLHGEMRDLPGATGARRMLVESALRYLDELSRQASDDDELQLELATAYEQIGEIQGNPHYTNLGNLKGAAESYQKSVTLREAIWRLDTTNVEVTKALADVLGQQAVVTSWGDDNRHAIEISRRAVGMLRKVVLDHEQDGITQHFLGRIESELGWWLIWEGQREEGLSQILTATRRLGELIRETPEDVDLQLHQWRAWSYRMDGLRFSERTQDALDLVQDVMLPPLLELEIEHPNHPRIQYALHVSYDYAADMLTALGEVEPAIVAHRNSMILAEAMVAADPTNEKAYEALGRSHAAIGSHNGRLGRPLEAAVAYQKGANIFRRLLEGNPANASLGNMLGGTERWRCFYLLEATHLDAALAACLRSVEALEETVASTQPSAILLSNLSSTYTYTARVYRNLGYRADNRTSKDRYARAALQWYDRALTIMRSPELDELPYSREVYRDSVTTERESLAIEEDR